MNSVNISGNLIREAEIKYIGKNNTPCVEFVIARSHKFKNEKGNIEEQVMFFEVVLFGQFGEKILKYLGKGKKVYVQGELRQGKWEYEGKKHSKISIVAQKVFLEGRDIQNTESHKSIQNTQNQESQNIEAESNGAIVSESVDLSKVNIGDELPI
ncbi:single stranded DNA-binding protein [Helicobacter fennelliae]|uniref:Single-stranded DNA-binding protein n=1 Tax=Helicobacter fennelliae TaxID=215 RepID=A0A2X3E1R8_9HELI|nr:single-stranded DNA-binding protein [Helicobacter fennelliae]SQC36298.1 single stranded DNA-binding protein [Helicobacter fennelliae]